MCLGSSGWSPSWSPSHLTFLCSLVISLALSQNEGARISPFNLLCSDICNIRTLPGPLCVLNYLHLIDVWLCFISVFEVSEWERKLFYELSLYANSGSYFQRLAKLALRLLHSGITYWFCWPFFFFTLTDSTGWLMFASVARLCLPPSDWYSMLSLLIGLLRRKTQTVGGRTSCWHFKKCYL